MAFLSPTARYDFGLFAAFSEEVAAAFLPPAPADAAAATAALGGTSRRRDCHLADVPSKPMLKHLLHLEGGAVK